MQVYLFLVWQAVCQLAAQQLPSDSKAVIVEAVDYNPLDFYITLPPVAHPPRVTPATDIDPPSAD